MKKIKVATLFSGIGAPEWALKRLGVCYETVLACDNGDVELDNTKFDYEEMRKKIFSFQSFEEEEELVDYLYSNYTRKTNFVKKSYLANYPDFSSDNYYLDVMLLNGKPLKGKVDLLVGGSPCQSFSTVGYQKGLNDPRGNLFFEYVRLVEEIQPKVFIYENVSGIRSNKNKENWEKMREKINLEGYTVFERLLNSTDFGIPQVRNRVFLIGFKDFSINDEDFQPKKRELYGYVNKFLINSTEDGGVSYDKNGDLVFSEKPGKVDDKYILTPAVYKYVTSPGTKTYVSKIEFDRKIGRTLLSTMGNHHRAGVDNYISDPRGLRALTERECLRLMGFTDDFKIVVSKGQMYKQIGNSMVVDVIMALLKEIFKTGIFGKYNH